MSGFKQWVDQNNRGTSGGFKSWVSQNNRGTSKPEESKISLPTVSESREIPGQTPVQRLRGVQSAVFGASPLEERARENAASTALRAVQSRLGTENTAQDIQSRVEELNGQIERLQSQRRTAASAGGTLASRQNAARDYDERIRALEEERDSLAGQYYTAENETQLERLAADTALSGQYESARDIQIDLKTIADLQGALAAGENGAAVRQAQEYLGKKYGLDESALESWQDVNYTDMRTGRTGEGYRTLGELYAALEERQAQAAAELEAGGYDYGRMAEYEQRQKDREEALRKQEQWTQAAKEDPVGASFASVIAAPLRGAEYLMTAAGGIGRSDTSKPESYVPLNTYHMDLTNMVGTVRQAVSREIEENTDWELFGQNAASFLYNTGMSIADSALQVGTAGKWATVLMGAGAAADQAKDIAERGGTNSQAFWGGLAAGAAEAVFEKFSIDRLLSAKSVNSMRSLLSETAKQAGVEASEESLTEIANILTDAAIMGENSNFSTAVRQYMGQGMSEAQAKQRAFLDSVGQVALAGLGGAISGGVMGGAVNAGNYAGTRSGGIILPTAEQNGVLPRSDGQNNTASAGEAVNRGETVSVVQSLRQNIPELSSSQPVYSVSTRSVQSETGRTMAEKARNLFEKIKGVVTRQGFGDIEINTRSVKDDLSHGIGPAKAAVIPSIPSVIQNGTQIDYQPNWKGRPYDGYVFAAPVSMDGDTVYVAAVVKRTSKNRFYLHEVVDSNGNIIKIGNEEGANPTSLAANGDAGTQSPLPSINSIPQTAQNVNQENIEPRPLLRTYEQDAGGAYNRTREAVSQIVEDRLTKGKGSVPLSDLARQINQETEGDNAEATKAFSDLLSGNAYGVNAVGNLFRRDESSHIDNRDISSVGDRKMDSFQFENPELHEYFADAAGFLLDELSDTIPGTRVFVSGRVNNDLPPEGLWYGYRRATTDGIAELKDDYRMTYQDIRDAAEAIIENHGQENYAAAKRVEVILDDMMTNGWRSAAGRWNEPNQAYIEAKRRIPGASQETERFNPLEGVDELEDDGPRPLLRTYEQDAGGVSPVVRRLSRALGRNIQMYDGSRETGARGAANGYYANGTIYVNSRSTNPAAQIIAHELTHSVEMADAYQELSSLVMDRIRQTGGNIEQLRQEKADLYRENGVELNGQDIDAEIVAEYVEKNLLTDEASIEELARTNRSLAQRIRDWIDSILARLGNADAQSRVFLERARDAYSRALQQTQGSVQANMRAESTGTTGRQAQVQSMLDRYDAGEITAEQLEAEAARLFGEQYSIDPDYEQAVDAWDRNGRPSGEVFVLGSTGDVLQGLGAMEQDIYLRSEKVNSILEQHPEMTLAEIKRIPEILDDPVLVLKSRNVGRGGQQNTRLVLFGTVRAENGQPVLAVLDLRPVENGLAIDDMQKVTSSYTKDSNPVWYVQNSDILHADKNRTIPLLRTIGFQTPIELQRSGSMGSISYNRQNVNIQGVPFDQVADTTQGTQSNPQYSIKQKETDAAIRANPSPGASRNTAPFSEQSIPQNQGEGNPQYSIGETDLEGGAYSLSEEDRNQFISMLREYARGNWNEQTIREYLDTANRNGTYDQGANAARPVIVPQRDAQGNPVRRTARTAMGAKAIPESVASDIANLVRTGQMSYEQASDKSSTQRAIQRIQDDGFDRSLEYFSDNVSKGVVSKDLVTLGQQLLVNAANAGDGKATAEILNLYAQLGTSAGQAAQAYSILRKLDPSDQLYGIQKTVSNLEREIQKRFKGKKITIDPSLLEEFQSQTDQAGRDKVMEKIYQNAADQIPSTWRDKWNAWRYMAMLVNPRTHIRNIAGNFLFQPVRVVKDKTAAAVESLVHAVNPSFEKTKSFAASPGLYKAAWNDFKNVKDVLSGNKYDDIRSEINSRRTVFGGRLGKPLEAVRKGNSWALEFEDSIFKRVTYADALAGYLQARGVTAEQLRNGNVDAGVLSAARDYAGQEALKATYQDRNQFSDLISSRFSENNTAGKLANSAVDAALPFRRTPANILVRGFEYSPLGLAKSLTADLVKVKRGTMSGAEAIDNIAAGLTGSVLFALGAYLLSEGLVTSGGSGDEEQEDLDELTGKQNYALNLPGGGSVTLDWLAPEALPFFMGVEFMEALGEEGFDLETVTDALSSISEPMLELSMLQSLNDLIDSVSYAASSEKMVSLAGSALISYLTQAVPTLGGQIERTTEENRMSSFTDRNSTIPRDLQYAASRASARLPGDYQQIPYIDAWGRTESNGGLLSNAFNNFLNPAYTSQINETAADREIQRLLDEGQTGVVPNRVSQSQKVDGQYLSADQYVQYATTKGQTSYDIVSEMIGSDLYQGMTDEQKADAIKRAYQYAGHVAAEEISPGHEADSYVDGASSAERDLGISSAEYLLLYEKYGSSGVERYSGLVQAGLDGQTAESVMQSLDSLKPQEGKSQVSDTQKWRAVLDAAGGAEEQMEALSVVMAENQYNKVKIAYDFNVEPNTYVRLRETMPDYDADGNGSYTNAEIEAAIDGMTGGYGGIVLPTADGSGPLNLTNSQKAVLWQLTTGSTSAKNNPYSVQVGQSVLDAKNGTGTKGTFTGGIVLPK